MMKNIYLFITVALILSILIFHLGSIYRILFRDAVQRLKRSKFSVLLTIGLSTIVVLLILASSLFGLFSMVPDSKRAYYKNPKYWHLYAHFRNEKITKFYTPAYQDIIAFYGDWEKVEEVFFDIEENPTGIIVKENKPTRVEFHNDSLLTMKLLLEDTTESYHHIFDESGNLIKIESDHSNEVWTYSYRGGRFFQYSHFAEGKIQERHVATYNGRYDYTLDVAESDGAFDYKIVVEHDFKGLPKRQTYIKEFEKPGLFLQQEKTRTVFEAYKIAEMSYRRENQTTTSYSLESDSETKIVIGAGRSILQKESAWKAGEDYKVFKRDFEYDQQGNWIKVILYKNNIAYAMGLRKITYRDGTSSGGINPEAATLIPPL